MADTAADQLAAIDTVANLLDHENAPDRRALAQLRTLRARIEQRAAQDEAVGREFMARYRSLGYSDPPLDIVGAAVRAAVEATGATITDPPPAPECADDQGDTANV
ncbi:hypothetical protein [Nocardia asteroides]|uniref:hypothetical protein n=1 Tax=Nocardia asteroides TaxID=1824 RepID=UPI0033EE609D